MSEHQSPGRLTTGTPSTVRTSSLFSAVFDWQIPTNHLCGENFAALFSPLPLPLPPAPPPAARCGQVGSEETEGAGGARCDWLWAGDWGDRRSPVWSGCEQETLLSGQLAGGCGSSVRDGRLLADWGCHLQSSSPADQYQSYALDTTPVILCIIYTPQHQHTQAQQSSTIGFLL